MNSIKTPLLAVAAVAVAASVVAAGAGADTAASVQPSDSSALAAPQPPTTETRGQPRAAPSSTPTRVLGSAGSARNLDRRFTRTVDGVRFSFSLSAWSRGGDDWSGSPIVHSANGFRMGRLGISKSIVGPQGAEAIIFWTSFPVGYRASPCTSVLGRHVRRSAAALATAVATAPGTKLVEGPSDVTVGGRQARHLVLDVRTDVGCDPGYFYSWPSVCWGPCWTQTNTSDRIRVWIVGVKGTLLFIEAETTPQADRALKREITQIVESIRFH